MVVFTTTTPTNHHQLELADSIEIPLTVYDAFCEQQELTILCCKFSHTTCLCRFIYLMSLNLPKKSQSLLI